MTHPRRSMTGFGRGEHTSETARVTVELRSVNHRFLDVAVKAPRAFLALESRITAVLRERLERGRIDVYIRREALAGGGGEARIDAPLARSIVAAAEQADLGALGQLSLADLLAQPGVLTVVEATIDADGEAPLVEAALRQALDALVVMREAEGERLRADVASRLDAIEVEVDALTERAAALPLMLSNRLHKKLETLLGDADIDPARLAQEVALLADKAGIDEEITRLRSHVLAAREHLAGAGSVGRKLDFLVQEFHREANTVSSKAADESITRGALVLKSEIEKIREQVANLE